MCLIDEPEVEERGVVQIEGGQTAVYVIYAISVLERKDPTECDFCE